MTRRTIQDTYSEAYSITPFLDCGMSRVCVWFVAGGIASWPLSAIFPKSLVRCDSWADRGGEGRTGDFGEIADTNVAVPARALCLCSVFGSRYDVLGERSQCSEQGRGEAVRSGPRLRHAVPSKAPGGSPTVAPRLR